MAAPEGRKVIRKALKELALTRTDLFYILLRSRLASFLRFVGR